MRRRACKAIRRGSTKGWAFSERSSIRFKASRISRVEGKSSVENLTPRIRAARLFASVKSCSLPSARSRAASWAMRVESIGVRSFSHHRVVITGRLKASIQGYPVAFDSYLFDGHREVGKFCDYRPTGPTSLQCENQLPVSGLHATLASRENAPSSTVGKEPCVEFLDTSPTAMFPPS